MLLPFALFLASAAGLPSPPVVSTRGETKPRLVILNLAAQGVGAEIVTVISDSLSAGLSRTTKFDVVSFADLMAASDLEAARQLTGSCAGQESCIAELATALGADLIVHGSVGRLGALTVVNVSLFDPRQNVALAREKVEAKRLENLAQKIDVATVRMLEAWEKKPLTPYLVINEADGPSVPVLTTGAVIGIVGVAGVIVGGLMMNGAQGVLENPTSARDAKGAAVGSWDLGSYTVIGSTVAIVTGAIVAGISFVGGP